MLYNYTVALAFLGSLIALALPVAIIYVKQWNRRDEKKKQLEIEKQYRPQQIGDIDAWLDDSVDYQKPNVFQIATVLGLQPLLIMGFVSLFTQTSAVESFTVSVLVVWAFVHEFRLADHSSKKIGYQLLMLLGWVMLFCILSYRTNIHEKNVQQVNMQQTEK